MVYVTGDTHADAERLSPQALNFMKPGDTLIICGDFGFIWDDTRREDKLLRSLGRRRYNICFIDGSHENFDVLEKHPVTYWNGGRVHRITGNLYHLMRGEIYRVDSQSIFCMGGGEQPETLTRFLSGQPGKEMPSREELTYAIKNLEANDYKVDVIITHEPPAKIRKFLMMGTGEPYTMSSLNVFFDELEEATEYKRWYFGSMHMDKLVSSSCAALFKSVINVKTGERVSRPNH